MSLNAFQGQYQNGIITGIPVVTLTYDGRRDNKNEQVVACLNSIEQEIGLSVPVMSEHYIIGKLVRPAGNVDPHPELEQARYQVAESCTTRPVPVLILEVFICTVSPAGPDEANYTPPGHDVETLLRLELQYLLSLVLRCRETAHGQVWEHIKRGFVRHYVPFGHKAAHPGFERLEEDVGVHIQLLVIVITAKPVPRQAACGSEPYPFVGRKDRIPAVPFSKKTCIAYV